MFGFGNYGVMSQKVRNTVNRIIGRDVRQGILSNSNLGRRQQLVDSVLLGINKTFSNMHSLIEDVNLYRNYYLVDMVIRLYTEEALSPDPTTDEVFRIAAADSATNSKEIQAQIDYLMDTFDIESIIRDNIEDMVFYNEYSFRLVFDELHTGDSLNNKKSGKGIINIVDGFAPGKLVAIYRKNVPIIFQELDGLEIKEYQPYEFWHFQLSPQKVRITNAVDNQHIQANPYTIRYGKPFIASVLPQIKELMTLEQTSISRSLSDLHRQSMVNVSVPESLDPEQLKELTQYYEDIINSSSKMGQHDRDNQSFGENVSSTLGNITHIKVIPSDAQRGNISAIDVKNGGTDDTTEKIKEKRDVILSSLGVTYDMLFSSEGPALNLRSFTTFQKRVKQIQIRCANAIKQLVAIQCASVGIQIEKLEDITVNYTNSINTAELDRLEFQDTKMQSIMDFVDRIQSIREDETLGPRIDENELMEYLRRSLSTIKGAEKIVKDTSKKDEQ